MQSTSAKITPITRIQQPAFKSIESTPLPEATDLEAAVLGGLMFLAGASNTTTIDSVLEKLEAQHFYLSSHAKVYRAIAKLHGDGVPADMMTVLAEMDRVDPAGRDGRQGFICDLLELTSSPAMIEAYADIVIQKAYRRDVIRQSMELLDLASDQSNESADLLEHIESKLLALLVRRKTGGRSLSESMPIAFANLQEAVATGVQSATPTGFDDLNTALNGGFRAGQLIVIAGRPSMGKSAFAIGNILPYMASVTAKTCLCFSLEMSEEELIHRFWASQMARPHAISHLDLTDRDWNELGEVITALSELKIVVDETPKVSIEYIRSECRKQKAIHGDLGVVMIDYLQIMDMAGGNANQSIGNITSSLKALAKELKCPIVVLSQLSRGVESRDNKRPTLSDLRDSGSIEQDSDIVLFLYRDDYYNEASERPGVTEVIIGKQRGGKRGGTVELLFDGPRTTFSSLSGTPPQYITAPQAAAPEPNIQAAPIEGFELGDRVQCVYPSHMNELERKESQRANEAPYGQSGEVCGFIQQIDYVTDELCTVIQVRFDSGKTVSLYPNWLQSDF